MARVHCTSHCGACGSHFHSTSAFDAHRQFEDGHDGDWDYRVCEPPEDVKRTDGSPRLGTSTRDGICALAASELLEGVEVWTEAESLSDETAERLRALQEKAA